MRSAPSCIRAAAGAFRRPVELRELVKQLGFPCTNTLMGLGAYPATDRQFLGMLGMHGTAEANMAMQHCDVLLAIGARFDDRVIGNPAHPAQNPRKIVHIDIDPSSISKRVKVDADRRQHPGRARGLAQAPQGLEGQGHFKWWKQIDGWRAKDRLRYDRKSPIIKPQFVLEKLYEVTRAKPSSHRTSARCGGAATSSTSRDADQPGGLGTMDLLAGGDGRAAREPRGDGGVRHRRVVDPDVPPGASTCKQYRLPIKIINLNKYMGMVRQWQEFFHGNRYSESYMDALPDFVARRGLRPPRRARREAGRRRAHTARGVRGEERPRLPRFHHRPESARTSTPWCPAARASRK